MTKVFNVLKTFKAQDEYIWKEYIKFLYLQISIQTSKKNLIEVDNIPAQNFVTQVDDFNTVFDGLYTEIYEAMIKRMHSLMTLGWHNDQ